MNIHPNGEVGLDRARVLQGATPGEQRYYQKGFNDGKVSFVQGVKAARADGYDEGVSI